MLTTSATGTQPDDVIEPDLTTFQGRFKYAKQRANIGTSVLAGAIGVTFQAIWNYENRPGGMSSDKIFLIADLLGVSARWLATGVDDGVIGEPPLIDPTMHPALNQSIACLEAFLERNDGSSELVKAALSILKNRKVVSKV